MIDLHTHVLPYIDDGSKSIEESVELLNHMKSIGISTVVATPHYYSDSMSLDKFLAKRKRSFDSLSYPEMTIILGSETMFSKTLFQYKSLDDICILGTRYLLLELSYASKWDNDIMVDIENLINMYNVIPIIAHVERYQPIRKNYKLLRQFKQMGCLIQLNSSSLLSFLERGFAVKLIKKGLIDVVASDTHDLRSRRPSLPEAYAVISKKCGENYSKQLELNCNNILKELLVTK